MTAERPYCDERTSVYPGEFVPKVDADDLAVVLNEKQKQHVTEPLVNVTELENCFKIEVAVPGVNREDFFIRADNNVLSIIVYHKESEAETDTAAKVKDFELHEFSCTCFQRYILLPENVDAGFAAAEYHAGILSIHLPKMDRPIKQPPARIVVY